MMLDYGKTLLFATVLAVLNGAFVSGVALATPAQVLIIRHAEKPDSGDDLSPAGYARAQALVNYFETNPNVTTYGTPVAIYAQSDDASDRSASRRPIETVTPLAEALGLKIQSDYSKKEGSSLAKEIMNASAYDGRMVLICWEHNKIPGIAQDFGVKNAPDSWDDSDYYDVWEIDFSGHKVSGFNIFSEALMSGDPANH